MMYFFKAEFACTNSDARYPDMETEKRFITIERGDKLQDHISRIERELKSKYKRVHLIDVENISTPSPKRKQ